MDLKNFELHDTLLGKHHAEQQRILEAKIQAAEQQAAEQERERQAEPLRLLTSMLAGHLDNTRGDRDKINESSGRRSFSREFELLPTESTDGVATTYSLTLLVEGSYLPDLRQSLERTHDALRHGCRIGLRIANEHADPTEHWILGFRDPSRAGLPPESMGFINGEDDAAPRMRLAYAMIREAAALDGHSDIMVPVPEDYDPAAGWLALGVPFELQATQSV